MKTGILTQPLLNNYGGLIQNFALQKALQKLGHDPITIDQKSKELPLWRVTLGRFNGYLQHWLYPDKIKKPRYLPTKNEQATIEKNTRYFRDNFIIHTRKCEGGEDFKYEVLANNIEAIVVGSDQCWRPTYNDYIEDMFLKFTEGMPLKKRMSYAASFGTDQWVFTPGLTKTCASLAKKFDLITVREDSGVKLCEEYLGVKAFHVLDPTMLLSKEDYSELIEQQKTPKSSGNLFNYILDPSCRKQKFVEEIASSQGLKPFQVLPEFNEDHRTRKNVKSNIENCVYPSPFAWLRAFMDSELIIVDSFHGMVFSIIFNKPFWVIGNVERGLSRFTSLLKMFYLEDRLINEKELDKIDPLKSIDWDIVNTILKEKREESMHFLSDGLNNNEF